MNIFIHSMALSAAQQWALNEGAGFGRYFDISALDKSWLAEASDDEMSGLHRLPTSPFKFSSPFQRLDRPQRSPRSHQTRLAPSR